MAERFVRDYGLPEYDAGILTQNQAMAAYFEGAATDQRNAKLASNWTMGEMSRRLNADGLGFGDKVPVRSTELADLIGRIADGTISNNAAKQVFDALWASAGINIKVGLTGVGAAVSVGRVDRLIAELGLTQMNDSSALEAIIDEVLATNAKNVAEFKAGNAKAFNALVGQAMKASKGKANPAQVNELLKQRLA
jgi:aspartyl-tRNA(Asn)/glutamyl-tRNA(Gln) amidotransferase subunit B